MTWILLILQLANPITDSRLYHRETVESMRTSRHTHVEVTGRVTLTKRERDGDWHVRLTDGKSFIVAEIIPDIIIPECDPAWKGVGNGTNCSLLHRTLLEPPRVGECVTVRGIRRYDNEAGHNWWEVHPVEQIEFVACPKDLK